MFEETFRKNDSALLREAEYYFHQAYQFQMSGHIKDAIEYYRKSIEIFPTSEAHTFLGWALSFEGDYQAAIAECETAIALDPDFGNPYNDIGAYLMNLKRFDEAVQWFERAKAAIRYEARHYPYFNLGRIKERQGDWLSAQAEYGKALELYPEYESAKESLHRVNSLLNRRN
jgi:tetratricopeptide (TPR) repeat protein